jgi:hypothetical protein
VSNEALGQPLTYSDEALAAILSPSHFVGVRRTMGGPAPEETARALGNAREVLGSHLAQSQRTRGAWADAEARLAARSRVL